MTYDMFQVFAMGREKVKFMVSLQNTEGEETTQIATKLNKFKNTGLIQTVGVAMGKQGHVQPRGKSATFSLNTITLLKCVGEK